MSKKKLQGIDGLNFELQLTVPGLENIKLGESSLKNDKGKDIVTVKCLGEKLSIYVNLPHAIRLNNVQPFQLSDCIKLELVRSEVIEFIKAYLQKELKDKYSDEFLRDTNVTSMECNLTIKCVNRCRTHDVVNLFEKAFLKTKTYKETKDPRKTHAKPNTNVEAEKTHYWKLKVYDKSAEQRDKKNLTIEPNLIRVELVFLNRTLETLYSNKRSLEDILTRKALKALIDQYQVTFDEICETNLKPMLNNCVSDILDSLNYPTTGNPISETLIRCKEYIVDIEVLRRALKKWYKLRDMPDNSKRIISYYTNHKDIGYGLPVDVLKTIKLMHHSTGKR